MIKEKFLSLYRAVDRLERKPWMKTLTAGIVLLCILFTVFLPEVFSVTWHLTHGSRVNHGGISVTVPRGWFAYQTEDVLVIARLGRFDLFKDDMETITIVRYDEFVASRLKTEVGAQRFRNHIVKREHEEGFELQESYTIAVEQHLVVCWEFSSQEDPKIKIECQAPASAVGIHFMGSRQ